MVDLIRSRPSTWRLATANAVVLIGVFVALAASPAPVTFPSSHWEVILLVIGAAVMLAANVAIAGASAVSRVAKARVEVDDAELLRLRAYEHFDVVAPDAVVGIVGEVLAKRDGTPAALVVEDGWFGSTRFLVPLEDVEEVDSAARRVRIAT